MLRGALTLLLLVALAAGAATAQDGVRPTFSKDRRGDTAGPLDIVRVALGRASDGKLRGEITMSRAWDAEVLRRGGPAASACLRLHTRRAVDAEPPDYLLCVTAPAEGAELVGRVLRERANGLPRPVGTAVISRPTDRTVFLRFTQTDIGKPSRVRFSAEAVTRGDGCSALLGCRDLAPDAPGAMQLPLRSTTNQR